LTGVIDWSWWWVLALLWVGPLAVSTLIAGFFLILFLHNHRVRRAMRRPLPGFPDGVWIRAQRPPDRASWLSSTTWQCSCSEAISLTTSP